VMHFTAWKRCNDVCYDFDEMVFLTFGFAKWGHRRFEIFAPGGHQQATWMRFER
jgi:hypothetical protein